MTAINSRADLENLRGTPQFDAALRMLHGSLVTWALGDGGWSAEEDLSAIQRLGYSKEEFLAEAAHLALPPPTPPLGGAPAPTLAQVIAERDRRLALGFDYDFGDARGVHRIGTTEGDMRGWDEVTKIALARHAVGATTTILIVTDTGPVEVTPADWLAILEAANTFRQPIWHASFAVQALDPIPADFDDDSRWP